MFYYGQNQIVEGVNEIDVYDSTFYNDRGINDIDLTNLEMCNVYYDFNVEKSGYYLISKTGTAWFAISESFDGTKADGCSDSIFFSQEDNTLYYLEEGLNIFGVYFYPSTIADLYDTVTVSFLGEEITDFTVDEETLDDFLIGVNVWEEETEDFGISTTSTVTFSSGETLEMTDVYFAGTCDSTPKEGKSKAVIGLLRAEKEIEFTAYYLENLIDSAEISNVEKYTECSIAYDGSENYADTYGEALTVNYSDGTSDVSFIYDNMAVVTLPNGMEIDAFAGVSYNDNGELKFIISIMNEIYAEYDIVETENTFFENIGALMEDNFEALSASGDDLAAGIANLFSQPDFAKTCFGLIFEDFAKLFVNFAAFVSYYIG